MEIDSNGVVTATGNLDAFNETAKKTEDSATDAEKGVKNFTSAFSGIKSAVSGALIQFEALKHSIRAVIDYVKTSISAFGEYESIKTNLSVVLGSAKTAEAEFERLKVMAAKTPFDTSGLANAAIQLKQTGTSVKNLIPTLQMLGDAADGNNEKFPRIVQNFAQIQSVGKASAIDMKQFAQMGLPVYQLIQKMGISGQATAAQVTEMFRQMTSEGGTFFNGMSLNSETLNGKASTLNDTWKDFQATFADTTGLASAWKTLMGEMTTTVQGWTDALTEKQKIKDALDAYNAGTATTEQQIIAITQLLNEARQKRAAYSTDAITSGRAAGSVADTRRQVELYTGTINSLQSALNKLYGKKTISDWISENNDKIDTQVEKTNSAYDDLMNRVNKINTESDNGKASDLLKQINELKASKTQQKAESTTLSTGTKVISYQSMSADDLNKINTAILNLTKQYDELIKKSAGKTWQDIFSDTTGVIVSLGENGRQAMDKFITSIEEAAKQEKELKKIAGEPVTIDDDISATKDEIKKIYEIRQKLLNEKDSKGGAAFTTNDNAIKEADTQISSLTYNLRQQNTEKKSQDYTKEISSLNKEWSLIGLSNEELERRNYLAQGFNDKQATTLAHLKEQLKYQEEQSTAKKRGDVAGYYTAKANEANENGNYLSGGKYKLYSSAASTMQNTDAGDFASGMMQGGPVMGVINMFVGAITRVLESIDGIDVILSPLTSLLSGFKPLLKVLLLPLALISKAFTVLGNVLESVLGWLLGDLDDLYDSIVDTTDAQDDETERLERLNEQYESLTEAIKEQEEYYSQKRKEIDADYINELISAGATSTNDMILTPQGNFSTAPDDYLIATKTPETLGSGGSSSLSLNVNIQNNASDSVDVTASTDTDSSGIQQLAIIISKKVAQDAASGGNGWDTALSYRTKRIAGKSIG